MTVAGPEPSGALQRCLDGLLGDIQTCILMPAAPATANHGALAELLDRLCAASGFLAAEPGAAGFVSASQCRALGDAWRSLPAAADVASHRQFLGDLLRCRDSLPAVSAAAVLQQVITGQVRAVIDRLLTARRPDSTDADQLLLQQTGADCRAIMDAMRFLAPAKDCSLRAPPPTSRDLLRWLLTLEKQLIGDRPPPDLPRAFRRELERCVQRCGGTTADDDLSQVLRELQLVAGALPVLGQDGRVLLVCSAQVLYQQSGADRVGSRALRELLRRTLCLLAGHKAANIRPAVDLALASLPAPALAVMRALLAVMPARDQATTDWAAISLTLYRLLVCLRMLAGGFVSCTAGDARCPPRVCWQILIASLYACSNHCVQQSVVTGDDQRQLLALLHRLTLLLSADTAADTAAAADELLPAALLLAARLGLRAQRHWQHLTLTLDATQQDFVTASVQQVLAAGLHYLPAMGEVGDHEDGNVLPQHVLQDLQLLLKGARIMNVPRIESLVLVMIEVYQQLVDAPALTAGADISKVLRRAHRSLCRMLDQAAAWQAPGNARRVINSLYRSLERCRGDDRADTGLAVHEHPADRGADSWQACLISNRRLRKLIRHQHDLDSIRALLLELLRGQEELIRRQADDGVTPDAPQV